MLLKIVKTLTLAIDAAAAMIIVTLAASMLPGDSVDVNSLGAVMFMAFVALVATLVSLPVAAVLRRRGDSLFAGIRMW